MDIENHNRADGDEAREQGWRHFYYYGGRACRVCVAVAPFVFFCFLLEKIIQPMLIVARASACQSTAMCSPQNLSNSSPFAVAQGGTFQGMWLFALLLVCVTVLLIVSMVLIGRVLDRD